MPAKILFPLYATVFSVNGYVMMLRSGSDVYVPLFTSLECFRLFRDSVGLDIRPLELANIKPLLGFLTNPPTPSGQSIAGYRVAFDLLDCSPGEILGWTVADLIAECDSNAT